MKIKTRCLETSHDEAIIPKNIATSLEVKDGDILTFESEQGPVGLKTKIDAKEGYDVIIPRKYKNLVNYQSKVSLSQISNKHIITLGADPECLIINKETNRIENAKNLITNAGRMKGYLGFPNKGINTPRIGNFGWDGAEIQLELRPSPIIFKGSSSHLVERMRELILKASELIGPSYKIVAKTYQSGICCGFHIHFGVPDLYLFGKGVANYSSANLFDLMSTDYSTLSRMVTRSLDAFIGLPSLISSEEQKNRVMLSKYGKESDSRKIHEFTVEYRLCPGSFLSSPYLTKLLLDTASSIVLKSMDLLKEITNNYDKEKVNDFKGLEKKFLEKLHCKNQNKLVAILNGYNKLTALEARKNIDVLLQLAQELKINDYERFINSIYFEKQLNDVNSDLAHTWGKGTNAGIKTMELSKY